MSRVSYSDDEDYPGQYALWQANCERSARGKVGQRVLREMEAALLALPSPRLIANAVSLRGEVCAVGAYLAAKKAQQAGTDIASAIATIEQECGDEDAQSYNETDELGTAAGMPRLVAWKLVALNDIEVPHGRYRSGVYVETTPEERYAEVLAWVRSQITVQP